MSNENSNLLREWADLWSLGNVELFLSLFAEECYYEDIAFGLVNRGQEQLKNFFIATRTALPDLQMTIQSCFASDTNGVIEWVMEGTHQESFHHVPATHQRIKVRGLTLVDIEDGKITANKDYYNLVTVLQQIGMFPEP